MNRRGFDKVDDKLFVGDFTGANDQAQLLDARISAVVQAVPAILSDARFPGINYLNVPVDDSPTENISRYLPEAIAFIQAAHNEGQNVLVHCAAGISRSSTVACAYLMVKHNMDFDSTLKYVRQSRPIATPNAGFQQQLRALPVQDLRRRYNF